MNRYICIHGHFYQPPRENPWLDEVEVQDSAYPYHDWNERITVECYARNASSRILDENRKIIDIVNNYSRMSFNFGPTLLSWMERRDPESYREVIAADKLSQKLFNGHGSAMAQVYNHLIMPLANTRDKRTQIIWGIKDFEYRFKRKPEGMWLAESAVDLQTLDMMAEQGIKFTVLAPHQAKQVRDINQDMAWRDVSHGKIDPRMPYQCFLPSGRTMAIFFYDGPVSQNVAFEGLLNNGEFFARRLAKEFNPNISHAQLVHIATDGETYGHHHKFGDMALAYCMHYLEAHGLAHLTVYADFLEKFPPTHAVEIYENSSWSCAHGVERWRSNCGCSTGGGTNWHQRWRTPLREALDWLRDELAPIYEGVISGFGVDPWLLRDQYIEVILDRRPENVDAFLDKKVRMHLDENLKTKVLKLLEMQHNAQLMFTSCGWFFNDISGIETVQILKYAARSIQLAKEISGLDLEEGFLERLNGAESNITEYQNGAHIYLTQVKPSVVDLRRVGAHYAISSLFEQYPAKAQLYSYTVNKDKYEIKEAGRLKLAIGRINIRSRVTLENVNVSFAVLHLGDHNFISGVDYLSSSSYEKMAASIRKSFLESDIPDVIAFINEHFGHHHYSLWDLFKQEQQQILNQVLLSTMQDIESSFRQIYDHHYPLMQIKNEIRLPLPRMLMTVVEFILNRDICALLESDRIDIERLKVLVEETKRWAFKRDQANFSFIASQRLSALISRLAAHPDDLTLLEQLIVVLELLKSLNLDLDLWRTQNVYFSLSRGIYTEILAQVSSDELASHWVKSFERLGELLHMKPQRSESIISS